MHTPIYLRGIQSILISMFLTKKILCTFTWIHIMHLFFLVSNSQMQSSPACNLHWHLQNCDRTYRKLLTIRSRYIVGDRSGFWFYSIPILCTRSTIQFQLGAHLSLPYAVHSSLDFTIFVPKKTPTTTTNRIYQDCSLL